MTASQELKALFAPPLTPNQEEEFSIPLDISDIISICREYHKLGWQIQSQVESILEVGVEEALTSGKVQKVSLPLIKSFLVAITSNPYFGDAVSQATDCVQLIQQYQDTHPPVEITN
jgi:hypothetical protein